MKTFFLFFFLLIPTIIIIPHANSPPKIDGYPNDEFWKMSTMYNIEMQNQIFITIQLRFMSEILYLLAEIPHNGQYDMINLNPEKNHDYFGIEFDNNGDGVFHGTTKSPDDMVLINYFHSGAQDLFTRNFKVFNDTQVNGKENAEGGVTSANGTIFFELSKELNSQDNFGADINIKRGDIFWMSFAFWDDRPVHDALVFTNKQESGKLFLKFTYTDENVAYNTTLVYLIISCSIITSVIIVKFQKRIQKV